MGIEILESCEGFEWDNGNSDKNWLKHAVSKNECEEIFFNSPLIVAFDEPHSHNEVRHFVLGQTNLNRKLFMAIVVRHKLIRVISARDMSKKERSIYEKEPS